MGRKDGWKDGRNAENYVPPLFFEKAGDNNNFDYLKELDNLNANSTICIT